jgi:valacyclovir hydrolase
MRPLLVAMSKSKYTIIAMDPLGYGKSRPPARDYSKGVQLYKMDAMTGVELMKSLGYPSFSWVGWSDGGRVGLVAAIAFPSRIDKLVIWGSAARVTARQQLALEGARDLGIWDPVRRQAFCDEYGGLPEATHVWGLHVDFYKTLGNICEEDVGKIRCPTLLLHGERDPIEKSLVQDLEKQISDSEFHVFPNAGHATHIEAKKDFVKIMERFLDQDM